MAHMRRVLGFLAVAVMMLVPAAMPVTAGTTVKVGVLSCGIAPGIGYIVMSQKKLSCVYQPSRGGRVETYRGKITRIGLDIGMTQQSVVVWAVMAPAKPKRGALQGSYGGVSAEATAIVGFGANVLVGGFQKSITLQPISIQAQTGLDLAAGIAGLSLTHVK
ncbi:MAG: DUF992 domain-containing protein [Rhizobiales bacterium]|nr:DUF992 domain-containing protein [Hyphomicrobiales bacterium]